MIGVVSDIHGNYPALKAVIKELKKFKCETIISLGDICGYYCMINECIELLKSCNVINIRGNHDDYVINNSSCPRSTTANICLDYQKKHITYENRKWLEKSVNILETELFSAVHGGWENNLDEYINADNFYFDKFENCKQKIFMSGHTHIQGISCSNNKTYFNPGSVGQPRDKNPKAAFAIIDNEKVNLLRINYDIDYISNEMRKNGFQERIYSNLRYGVKIGDNE